MITETVANWFLDFVAWLVGLLPAPSTQAEASFSSFDGSVASVFSAVSKFSPVVPFSDIGAAAATFTIFVVFAVAVQVGRIVLSVATLGSGSV